jgi:peptidoglycan hydrolase-like protein with peptidoglycan-binding domain
MSSTARRRQRLARRAAVTAAGVVAAGSVAVAATGFGFDLSSGSEQSGGHSDLPPATAKVSRQTLVDRQNETGDLGYGDTTTVSGRLSGTLTGLASTGSIVRRGRSLYRVDDSPVVLLYGSLPAYRALSPGTEGADVEQFERNLRALGYTGFDVDDEYTAATASAVKEWQDDLGLPETGTVDLGRVVYAKGAVRVDSQELALGDAVGPGTAVLAYTGTSRAVTVDLDMNDQRLARRGRAVTVTLPNDKRVKGTISKVETVVDSSGDGNGGGGGGGDGSNDPTTKIRVTIALGADKALSGLGDASVDVGFTASQRKNVLTVPVAALLALAEGGYGVEVVEGNTTRIVAVETGMFADGRVEVTGRGLSEGMKVGVPS